MSKSNLMAVTAWLAIATATISAGDLSKIARTIGKETAYKSKPKYCLVVYGPQAKTRVWLVVDGEVLYADRNGDGDLTGEGERILRKAMYDVEITARGGGVAFSLRLEDKPGRDGAETTYRIWCRPAKRKAFSD